MNILDPERGADEPFDQYRGRRAVGNAMVKLATQTRPTLFLQHTNPEKHERRRLLALHGKRRLSRHGSTL